MSDKDMVSREKYHEALDKVNKFKNMWHNTHQELEGYKEYQSVSNEELRALVEEWRELAEKNRETVPGLACNEMARACANQLEELIQE